MRSVNTELDIFVNSSISVINALNQIFFQVFLECLPETTEERIAKTNEFRAKYEIICNNYNRDPRDMKTPLEQTKTVGGADNPLSQDETVSTN